MLSCLKLPLSFDAVGLAADLNRIEPGEWIRHFNDRYYEGDWSGVAIRAIDGASNRIYPDPTKPDCYIDTPLLVRCVSIQRVLAAFACPLRSARLLRLGPGARIIEHRDYNLGLEDGEIRLHVPVTTSPLVEFYLNGERIVMNPGECWYINANLPHRIDNRGDSDRVHLVIDCQVDEWLRSLIDLASNGLIHQTSTPDAAKATPSSPEALNAFCNLVFEDAALQDALRSVMDKRLFIDLIVQLGEDRGFGFNAEDVEEALRAKRRAWFENWV